jgi:hypothetical protein
MDYRLGSFWISWSFDALMSTIWWLLIFTLIIMAWNCFLIWYMIKSFVKSVEEDLRENGKKTV